MGKSNPITTSEVHGASAPDSSRLKLADHARSTMQHKEEKGARPVGKKPEKRLIDGSTMADALAISSRTMHRLRSRGVIGFYRVGRAIRYSHDEVMASLADYHVMSRTQMAAAKKPRTQ